MAYVDVNADSGVVRLGRWERIGALHGDVRVSRSAVTGAHVVVSVPDPEALASALSP